MEKSAILSPDNAYRYLLLRRWDLTKPTATIVMLNPSTAGPENDDPTIRRLYGLCQRLDLGGFAVVNLYAYRATNPTDLAKAGWPIGDECDFWIKFALEGNPRPEAVICAWGQTVKAWPQIRRAAAVVEKAWAAGHRPQVFAWNGGARSAGGIVQPRHPLMLPYAEGVPLKPMAVRWPWNEDAGSKVEIVTTTRGRAVAVTDKRLTEGPAKRAARRAEDEAARRERARAESALVGWQRKPGEFSS